MTITLRQSVIRLFHRCPHQFELYHTLGPVPPSVFAHRGISVHRSAEADALHKRDRGENLPEDYLTDMAAETFDKGVQKGVFIPKSELGEQRVLLSQAKDAAVRLVRLYRRDVAPALRPALVEEKVVAEVGLDVPLEGRLDLTEVDDKLRDLKTAAKSASQADADTSVQITLYDILHQHKTGRPSKPSLIVLVDTAIPKAQVLKTERTEAHRRAFLERCRLILKQIKAGIFPPCDPSNWNCSEKWCGYWRVCKFGGRP